MNIYLALGKILISLLLVIACSFMSSAFAESYFACPTNEAFSVTTDNSARWELLKAIRYYNDIVLLDIDSVDTPSLHDTVAGSSTLTVTFARQSLNSNTVTISCQNTSVNQARINTHPKLTLNLGSQDLNGTKTNWNWATNSCTTTADNPGACSLILL